MNTSAGGRIHDVVVVGAGASGVGVGIALKDAGITDLVILERDEVGASFAAWPAETRFITPSFATNSFGMLDLNSVAIGVSPAYSLEVEHPSGDEYAAHLRAVASHFDLPIREGQAVTAVANVDGVFVVRTNDDAVYARHVVWAAGEFHYPRRTGFEGSELCQHTATIESYEDLDGNDFIVIGGYESGIDAAFHLAWNDRHVRLFDRGCPWESTSSDPSVALSPFTLERMREDWFGEFVELFPYQPVSAVHQTGKVYTVTANDGSSYATEVPPLWAGGFEGSHQLIADLFEMRPDGFPALTDQDESTRTPGLFLCGPSVRQENHIFCFIYKYRQRFAVVAKAIATSMGLAAEGLERYRLWGMYLDDLSCCGEECAC